MIQLTIGRSTRYDAKIIAVPNGIKARPRWTITMRCDDWKAHITGSRIMQDWITENMDARTRIHYKSAMSAAIEAVTFPKHADAMLFYLRFR